MKKQTAAATPATPAAARAFALACAEAIVAGPAGSQEWYEELDGLAYEAFRRGDEELGLLLQAAAYSD